MQPRPEILVVDDDHGVCDLLVEALEAFGHLACRAGNAAEALEVLRARPVSLVLSDIEMPGGGGFELLERIRTEHIEVDVIMVTGATDADTAIQAIHRGAVDYVTKPFNLNGVQVVIDRAFERRRLVQENRAHQEHLQEMVDLRTRELRSKTDEAETLCVQLADSYESTVQALMTALDFRDNETQGHSQRVVEYTTLVARQIDVREPELTWIRRGAILHDVGKIGVSDAVLRKPGKLDPDEWAEMRRHPELGYRMLKDIPFLKPSLDIVLCHQERFDGTGYPRGLAGERIPLGARIFAVVDTFDAMTSDRPYRKAASIPDACAEIRRCSGTQFDPLIADAFLSIDEPVLHEVRERVHRQVQSLGTPY